MNRSCLPPHRRHRLPKLAFGIACVVSAALSGCTGGSSSPPGSTTVTLLSTATANGQLSRYNATINSITLTGKSGNTVELLSSSLYPEFVHMNGKPEPLAVTSIPQDTYISATLSVGPTSSPV